MEFPLHENEILVWLLGTVVLGFLILYRAELRRLPAALVLFAAYVSAWIAWGATNLEHLFLYEILNVVEHVGYACNGVLLLVWCWLAIKNGKRDQHAYD